MEDSILESIKKVLGVEPSNTVFDTDIIMYINSTFSTLAQIGVGPDEGYAIEDTTPKWSDYLGTNNLINSVQSFMYLSVQLLFDPPVTSFNLTAKKELLKEIEWRLSVAVDKAPVPVVVDNSA